MISMRRSRRWASTSRISTIPTRRRRGKSVWPDDDAADIDDPADIDEDQLVMTG